MIIGEVLREQVGWGKTEPNGEPTALVWFPSVLVLLGYVLGWKKANRTLRFGSGFIGMLNQTKQIIE